ncbi:MAG: cell division protein ZapA [Pseudomonadota bacterium]
MATVDITINGRIFKVTCDAGQEERLQHLAYWADERLQMIAGEVGQIGDTRLLLLTLLMVCDELFDLKDGDKAAQSNAPAGASLETQIARETAAIEKLEATATRVRALSDTIGPTVRPAT